MHYGKVDSKTKSLKFCVSKPCYLGEQCYLSYGNFPSSHLITFYGFIPEGDNLYDVIPMGIISISPCYILSSQILFSSDFSFVLYLIILFLAPLQRLLLPRLSSLLQRLITPRLSVPRSSTSCLIRPHKWCGALGFQTIMRSSIMVCQPLF